MKKNISIIAEAGINHNGNLQKALKLVKIAKEANANYVKFQLFKTENFINKNFRHQKLNYHKIFKRFKSLEFSLNDWKRIIKHGKKLGIKVFFSVFDIESLKTLKKLRINLIKIPSGEINNFPLLEKINENKLKVILSTGMSEVKEIDKAIKKLKKCDLNLLHCVSEYPTTQPNLRNILFLKNRFKKKVGYSDHTNDVLTPALAVIAGANLIEKHFTYNKNKKNGDHKFSLSPNELKIMVKNIRFAEKSLGIQKKIITKQEKKLQTIARKGLYLNKNMFKGQKISIDDIEVLRPEGSLRVDKINLIKNKKLSRNIKKNENLKKEYFR